MAKIVFTPHLKRYLDCPPREVEADSVAEALEQAFAENPRLRSYLLDDQGGLRKHITIFIDGQVIRDRTGLTDSVGRDEEVYVLQALSGG